MREFDVGRMRRRLRNLVIGLVAPLAGACTIRSLDYLTDGPPDGGDGSAGSDSPGGDTASRNEAASGDTGPNVDATVDSGADVSTVVEGSSAEAADTAALDAADVADAADAADAADSADAADTADTGTIQDASMESDVASGTWCQQQPVVSPLCMDFDEQPGGLNVEYRDGFLSSIPSSILTAQTGCTNNLVTPAKSPPYAYGVTVDALDAGKVACLYNGPYTLPSTVTSLRLQFDMNVVAFTSANSVDYAELYLPAQDGGADYSTFYSYNQSQGGILWTQSGNSAPVPLPAVDGTYHSVRLDLTLSAGQLIFALQLDGTPIAANITEPAPMSSFTGAYFNLGASTIGPSAPLTVNYDNVVFGGQ